MRAPSACAWPCWGVRPGPCFCGAGSVRSGLLFLSESAHSGERNSTLSSAKRYCTACSAHYIPLPACLPRSCRLATLPAAGAAGAGPHSRPVHRPVHPVRLRLRAQDLGHRARPRAAAHQQARQHGEGAVAAQQQPRRPRMRDALPRATAGLVLGAHSFALQQSGEPETVAVAGAGGPPPRRHLATPWLVALPPGTEPPEAPAKSRPPTTAPAGAGGAGQGRQVPGPRGLPLPGSAPPLQGWAPAAGRGAPCPRPAGACLCVSVCCPSPS